MTTKPTDPGRGSSIQDEHVRIRRILGDLAKAPDAASILPVLETLRGVLAEHFAHEEAEDGLHAAICETAPRYEVRVKQCLAEHGEFLATVDRLVELCRNSLDGPLREIDDGIVSLIQRIQAHDANESEMLTEASTLDLGGRG